jgi:hypothetical protein
LATASLALMAAGTGVLLVGAVAAFFWRNRSAGVTTSAIYWAGSSLAAHPERYIRPDRVRAIRVMNLAGVGLFLSGVLVILAHLH